jgi:hypothetical protein
MKILRLESDSFKRLKAVDKDMRALVFKGQVQP